MIPPTSTKRRKKVREKKGGKVHPPKSPEVKYRKQLDFLVQRLIDAVNITVIPILRQFETEFVNDAYATSLEQVFENLSKSYEGLTKQAAIVANEFVEDTDAANKKAFYKSVENAIGINLQSVIQGEGLEDVLKLTARENVNLITSIPAEFLSKVETIVFVGTTQGSEAGSIIEQLRDLGDITKNRAKLIARDQTSKLNAALSQQRQQNLGVTEYIWITAKDGRVRESHQSKNGKKFRWDNPPKDTGHPGTDIQCRCIAQPIIKI